MPDGCVAEAQRLVTAGKRVVLCTAIRFEMEGIEKELIARGLRRQPNEPLTISRRQAVEIGLRNLHSESRAGKWEAPYFGELNQAHGRNQLPTCCYWSIPKEDGILIFTHNWAPFVINFEGLASTTPHRSHGGQLTATTFTITSRRPSKTRFTSSMTPTPSSS